VAPAGGPPGDAAGAVTDEHEGEGAVVVFGAANRHRADRGDDDVDHLIDPRLVLAADGIEDAGQPAVGNRDLDERAALDPSRRRCPDVGDDSVDDRDAAAPF
jgi:hypothetical protein